MAAASPMPSLEAEYESKFHNNTDDVDSEEEDEDSYGASTSKQNGDAGLAVDRYGFVGGDQYTNPEEESRVPVQVLRRREVKWLDMMENWEKWMSKRFKKVKERCRKGIPPSLRSRAWQYLCGSKYMMDGHKGRYESYLNEAGDPRFIDDIEKDLHRQFPFHEMFQRKGGTGQEDLFQILKAYTIHNPAEGYCQAQAPIAAILLMHMPAEQAFWCLVAICEKYLPGYYAPGLEAVQIDGDVLFGLIKKSSYPCYKHLKKHRIEPILYMTEWFMCVFTRTLPWSSVLRVWDIFFCEGVKVMFRVGLVIFRSVLGRPEQLAMCNGLYETLEVIRHIPHEYMEEEYLVREMARLPVSEKDMEKEHQKQLSKRRQAKESSKSPNKKKKNKSTSSADER